MQRWWLELTEFVDPWPFLVAWHTFLPPTLWPSSPCFSRCGRIHLAPSYLLSGHSTTLFREIRFFISLLFTMAPPFMQSHSMHIGHTGCGSGPDPVVNNASAKPHNFMYVKNNKRVLHFKKVSERLISQVLPWLTVKVLVCETTISQFTDMGS